MSKFTFVAFYDKAGKMNAASFLEHAIEAFPYKIHTVLTDNGVAFADLPKNRTGPNSFYVGLHIFGRASRKTASRTSSPSPTIPGQRPGRADELHHQGRDAQSLPLP